MAQCLKTDKYRQLTLEQSMCHRGSSSSKRVAIVRKDGGEHGEELQVKPRRQRTPSKKHTDEQPGPSGEARRSLRYLSASPQPSPANESGSAANLTRIRQMSGCCPDPPRAAEPHPQTRMKYTKEVVHRAEIPRPLLLAVRRRKVVH
ncbi:uncharacterized protein LOC121521666 isoform X2 [Cheilinus undulatus]|uniref:uncharacterized protein LOC121521666 isoform X2 n=1 Tax=Cheilinus undulatus TaxID=241271 RepID=UPI001BD3708E|nr:uncharacterized protein LOC121521666 isoform X2 [Cheilinus undulatus]